MMLSMTGYGKAELNLPQATFTIEVRSLNSKQLDAHIKMSPLYRDKEIGLRKNLAEKLVRGKIELSIWRDEISGTGRYSLNKEVAKGYYQQLEAMREEWEGPDPKKMDFYQDLIPNILRLPDVFLKSEEATDDEEWVKIELAVQSAIDQLVQFRTDEGKKLEEDITKRIHHIATYLEELAPLAQKRIKKVKSSLYEKLAELASKNVDQNRFEQELIYYLEKQDITEEQVRLSAHLKYFLESIETSAPKGKKLGFIAQEIGREVNTIGSKSSEAGMQKVVVQMKDELEKIKEQLLNVL